MQQLRNSKLNEKHLLIMVNFYVPYPRIQKYLYLCSKSPNVGKFLNMIKHILSVCICRFTTSVHIWQMVLVVKDHF